MHQIEGAQRDVKRASEYFSLVEAYFSENMIWLHLLRNLYMEERIDTSIRKCKNLKITFFDNFLITETLISNFEKRAFVLIQKYILILTVSKLVKKFAELPDSEQFKFFKEALSKLKNSKAHEL